MIMFFNPIKRKIENPRKPNFYFAVFGDSIARGSSLLVGDTPILGTVKEWNGTSFDNIVNADFATALNGSPWPAFGIDLNQKIGSNINISHSGFGGSEFSPSGGGDTNNWSSNGVLYTPSVAKAQNMLADAGQSQIDGILIILGINDARGSIAMATIEADAQSLITRLNSDFNTPNIYFAQIGRTEIGVTQRVLDVRAIIDDLVIDNANVFMAYEDLASFGDELYEADLLHPNYDGNKLIGEGFATFINSNL